MQKAAEKVLCDNVVVELKAANTRFKSVSYYFIEAKRTGWHHMIFLTICLNVNLNARHSHPRSWMQIPRVLWDVLTPCNWWHSLIAKTWRTNSEGHKRKRDWPTISWQYCNSRHLWNNWRKTNAAIIMAPLCYDKENTEKSLKYEKDGQKKHNRSDFSSKSPTSAPSSSMCSRHPTDKPRNARARANDTPSKDDGSFASVPWMERRTIPER